METKKYKYLVCDYDGTLVDDNKKITPKTLDAINNFIKRGGVFIVCTGRMTSGIDHLLKKEGLNCLLSSFNGAELSDIQTSKILYRYPIDNKTCIKFFKMIEEFDVNVQCYPKRKYIASKLSERTDLYSKLNGVLVEEQKCISKYLEKTGEDSSKILIFDEKEKLDKIFEYVKENMPECNVIRSNDEHVDINLKGISKGTACKLMADYFKISVEDMIAVGDAGNDISMLKTVGFPIAMGNASQEVKNICKVTCPDNNSDGIKFVIDNFCI